jgi:hypothetical protein
MTKIAGSGSISQRHGSADPDPPKNVMDPQHWYTVYGTHSHREGEKGGRELTREKVRGAIVHKAGRKSPVKKLLNTSKDNI